MSCNCNGCANCGSRSRAVGQYGRAQYGYKGFSGFDAFGFGDDSSSVDLAASMDAVLARLNDDYSRAWSARLTSFNPITGSSIDDALSNYQNMIFYLAGDGRARVLAGSLTYSTGDTWAPGWLETAQGIEDGLASTTGVVSRTDLTSLSKNFVGNLPTPTGGPSLIPWWWWALGGVALVGWTLSQGKGLVSESRHLVQSVRGYSGYRHRRAKR